MKLISLNIWGGHELSPLLDFIKVKSKDTDIFCFQEVADSNRSDYSEDGFKYDNLKDLIKVLPDFNFLFHPAIENYYLDHPVDFDLKIGLAVFVKKNIQIKDSGEIFIFLDKNKTSQNKKGEVLLPENLQYIKINEYVIAHLHGLIRPGHKRDTKDRIKQSEIVKKFLDQQIGKIILTGDFNLMPSTKSIKMLETGMVNLIKKFGIKKTRSSLNWQGKQRFADFTFVSENIQVIDYKVPEDVLVSDHLPLILEFK